MNKPEHIVSDSSNVRSIAARTGLEPHGAARDAPSCGASRPDGIDRASAPDAEVSVSTNADGTLYALDAARWIAV